MKKCFYLLLVLVITGLAACDGSKNLGNKIEGSWSGAPERLENMPAASSTFIPTFVFDKNDTGKSGTVVLSGLISVSNPINAPVAFEQPFSMSASASSMITGTWEAVSDDDIVLMWNDQSLSVDVDPQAVVISSELLDESTSAKVDSMRPGLVESLKAQILKAVEIKVLGVKKLDDIKIKDGLMRCEINDTDYSFRLQGE